MQAVIKGVRPLKSGAFTATPAYKIQYFSHEDIFIPEK
jgi:hypothetical protein